MLELETSLEFYIARQLSQKWPHLLVELSGATVPVSFTPASSQQLSVRSTPQSQGNALFTVISETTLNESGLHHTAPLG